MSGDSFVQVAPDSSGKKIDTAELTVAGQLVERQRIALGDGSLPGNVASIDDLGQLHVADDALNEALSPAAQSYADPNGSASLYDLLDTTSPGFVPLGVAPAGIDATGQRDAANSFPVTLATEQVVDAVVSNAYGSSSAILGANVLSQKGDALNVNAYRSISVQLVTPLGATQVVVFEGSNDGAGWVPINMVDSASTNYSLYSMVMCSGNTVRFFEGPLRHALFRVRVTSITGPGCAAMARLSMAPYVASVWLVSSPSSTSVAANITGINGYTVAPAGASGLVPVAGNVAAGNIPTGYPIGIGGPDANNKMRAARVDQSGAFSVVPDPRVVGVQVNPLLVTQIDQPDGVRDLLAMILIELRNLNAAIQTINSPVMDDASCAAYDPTLFNQ